MLFHAVLVKS